MPELRASVAPELGMESAPSDGVVDGEHSSPSEVLVLLLCDSDAVVAWVLGVDVYGEHSLVGRGVNKRLLGWGDHLSVQKNQKLLDVCSTTS